GTFECMTGTLAPTLFEAQNQGFTRENQRPDCCRRVMKEGMRAGRRQAKEVALKQPMSRGTGAGGTPRQKTENRCVSNLIRLEPQR
ncbi:hypothetical protein ACS2TD_27215, partial [Bacillus cereus group sp. BC334]|uniref:hypothetical protein n=1 Tax=Bacillus cereus group sp. BC334 TaxID=3445305 RepID=UPI003F24F9D1